MITKFKLYTESKKDTELIDYIIKNDTEGIKKYIADGKELNTIGNNGFTSMIAVVYYDSLESFELLFDAGINIDLQNVYGNTALNWSSTASSSFSSYTSSGNSSYFKWVVKLLEYGAEWFSNYDKKEGEIFFDNLNKNQQDDIKKLYPEQYKKYLKQKTIKKFKI